MLNAPLFYLTHCLSGRRVYGWFFNINKKEVKVGFKNILYTTIAVVWAAGEIVHGYVIDKYEPRSIDAVAKIQKKYPDVYAIMRSKNMDKSILVRGPFLKFDRKWEKLAKETDKKAGAYLLKSGNEIALLWSEELYIFGDIDQLAEEDVELGIKFLLNIVQEDFPDTKIVSNFGDEGLVMKVKD